MSTRLVYKDTNNNNTNNNTNSNNTNYNTNNNDENNLDDKTSNDGHINDIINLKIPEISTQTPMLLNDRDDNTDNEQNQYNNYYWYYYNQYNQQYHHNQMMNKLEKNIDLLGTNLLQLSTLSFEQIEDLKKSNEYVNLENDELKDRISHLQYHIEKTNKREREIDDTATGKKIKLIIKNPKFNSEKHKDEDEDDEKTGELRYDYKKNKKSYSSKKILEIKSSIKTINEIINLKDKFKEIRHDEELVRLYYCIESLDKLNNMIGMEKIKDEIFKHLIYYIKNRDNDHMLHTVITGCPGTGKTELGSILANIYLSVGALKKDVFKIVKRSDLIAGYLGQTAIKTQKIIDECDGGVLFIDEAYSLGNSEQRDSFSKECLDTLNLNLTEKKNTFMCIIAGYPEELEKCFFAYNAGLERRFSFKYDIDKYASSELKDIFMKKINENKLTLKIEEEELNIFFEKYYEKFKFFGGDIEKFLFYIKLEASTRCFQQNIDTELILKDLDNSIVNFCKKKEDDTKKSYTNMYL
jgi:hypothetical protein